jgi:hypothetical protein
VLAAGVTAVALGAAAVGAVALVVRGGRPAAGWAGGTTYLALDVEGDLAEEPPSGLSGLFESHPPSIRALVEAVTVLSRSAGQGPLLQGSVDVVGAGRAADAL